MLIFAGVDGTGATVLARGDTGYTPVYQSSHVSKLSRYACWADKAQYDRGPGLIGFETGGLAQSAVNHVVRWWDSSSSKVFLAGFSRGAAAVIESARILKGYGIPVECLILFDPVDRSYVGGVGGWSILPGRHAHCQHGEPLHQGVAAPGRRVQGKLRKLRLPAGKQ